MHQEEALWEPLNANRPVVGTSLVIYSAAEKVIVDLQIPNGRHDFTAVAESAETGVRRLVRRWLGAAAPEAG